MKILITGNMGYVGPVVSAATVGPVFQAADTMLAGSSLGYSR